jgi:hypothetical protein
MFTGLNHVLVRVLIQGVLCRSFDPRSVQTKEGVFTVPVGGIYGFTYNVRMGCHTSIAAGPFEIIKNDENPGKCLQV